ncbi:MAG: hypothetical protein ABSD29_15800 [Verrucomicrobiota bacterium]|jgi:hypothetical protein
MKNYSHYSQRTLLYAIAAAGAAIGVSLLTVLAQSVPQPVLSITSLGTNQFQIGITNGVTNALYELYWRPVLEDDPNNPWQMLTTNQPGQTSFWVDGSEYASMFFKAAIGTNYSGVWDFQLANPNDPSLGALSITIDSPTNNAVLQ